MPEGSIGNRVVRGERLIGEIDPRDSVLFFAASVERSPPQNLKGLGKLAGRIGLDRL